MAEVMHFYGMSFEELVGLSVSWFCKLYNRIGTVDARRQAAWLPVYCVPHMEQKAGQRTIRDINKKAHGIRPSTLPNEADEATIARSWNSLREKGIHATQVVSTHKDIN